MPQGIRMHFLGFTLMQPQYAVAAPRKVEIMGDNQRSEPVLAMKPLYQLENQVCGAIVQIAGWFIGHQDLRPSNQCPRQRDPLLLAAGEFTGAMTTSIFQSHFAQPAAGRIHGLMVPRTPHQKRHSYILLCRKFRQQIVELPDETDLAITKIRCRVFRQFRQMNLGAVYVTIRSSIKRSENVQQTAFAGPRLAHNRQHLSLPHPEG